MIKDFKKQTTLILPMLVLEKPKAEQIKFNRDVVNTETGETVSQEQEGKVYTMTGVLLCDELKGFQTMLVNISQNGWGGRIDAMTVMEKIMEHKEQLMSGDFHVNAKIILGFRGKDGKANMMVPYLEDMEIVASSDEDKAFIQKYLAPAQQESLH